ncbi:hypothetical protein [Streptomyces flaveolus]|uniref:hypothetical protein n=1 Tax=Streptomyces flaveolus TaxID=67297 RepID=UPI003D9EDF94
MITSEEGNGTVQPLWLSYSPPSADLWPRLRAEHAASGLWPLLLDPLGPHDTDFCSWACGELSPERMSAPVNHDPESVLARWWRDHTATDEDDDRLDAEERLAVTAPFGQTWPGLTPATAPVEDADATGDQYARAFLAQHPYARLGLVAAPRGADELTTAGWNGPVSPTRPYVERADYDGGPGPTPIRAAPGPGLCRSSGRRGGARRGGWRGRAPVDALRGHQPLQEGADQLDRHLAGEGGGPGARLGRHHEDLLALDGSPPLMPS